MDYHLSDDTEAENSRNGYGRKSVSTGTEKIEIAVPRDRAGSFDPQLIAKRQRRFPGFDDKIITHYHSDSRSEVVTARSPPIACRSARKGPPCSMALSSGLDQILCSHRNRYRTYAVHGWLQVYIVSPARLQHLPQSHLASHPHKIIPESFRNGILASIRKEPFIFYYRLLHVLSFLFF